jgi:hypothetical protein
MTQRLLRALPAVCVLGFFLLVSPGQARAQSCESICTPQIACTKRCIIDLQDWPREWTTCGQWGSCNYCTPNWQVVSTGPAAGFVNYNDYPINQCNTFTMTRIVERDLNACNPNNLERHHCISPQVIHLAIGCCPDGCTPQIQDYTNCN